MAKERICSCCNKLPARWSAVIKLWAASQPTIQRTAKTCATLNWDMVFCDDCKEAIKIENLLVPAGRERIANEFQKAGRAVPDFDAAVLQYDELVDGLSAYEAEMLRALPTGRRPN